MSEELGVSRRESLKSLGAMGAVLVLGGTAGSARAAEPAPNSGDQDKQAANAVDLAAVRFAKGHTCAGAVFSAFSEQMGIDDQTAAKLGSGFGGGMYLGSVCGAVTGGIMALGLKYGGATSGPNSNTPLLVRAFAERFKAQHRSVNCADLTGVDFSKPEILKKLSVDLSTPEGLKAAKEALGGRDPRELFAACQGYVKDAAKIVAEMMADAPK